MDDFLDNYDDNDVVTPESLAWKILMDDDVEAFTGIILPCTSTTDDDNQNQNINVNNDVRYNSFADQFQILITVYMEMVFSMLKFKHITENLNANGDINENKDLDATFKPDLHKFTTEDMSIPFKEKLKKIRIALSIREIRDGNKYNSKDFGSNNEYYCRIILKDTQDGKTHFRANAEHLDPEKRYTFVIRNDEKKVQQKLEDFYAVCSLPNIKVRIAFSPINVIVKNQHIGM